MSINQAAAAQSQAWVLMGWGLLRKNAVLWSAISLTYTALALVLNAIPFIGYLILVLLTPMLLGGAALTAQQVEQTPYRLPSPAPLGDSLKTLFVDAAHKLFQVFFTPDRALALMVVATFTLGGVVLLQIVADLLKVGGKAIPAMLAGSVRASIWLPALVSLAVVWTLKFALFIAATMATYLVVFRQEPPLAAMEHGTIASAKNARALVWLAVAFLLPLALLSYLSPYLVLAGALLLLPPFVTASYSGFKTVFPRPLAGAAKR